MSESDGHKPQIYHPRAAAARPRTHKEFINPGDLVKFIYFLCARRQGPSWLRCTDRPLVSHSDVSAEMRVVDEFTCSQCACPKSSGMSQTGTGA